MNSGTVDYNLLDEGQKTMGLELAGVALIVVDYVADTVTPDPMAAELFGLSPNQPVSRDAFHARIHPDDLPQVLAEVEKLIDPDFDDMIEVVHRTLASDGRIRWVHARKKLYRGTDERGKAPVSGVAAILDITGRKQAEEATAFLMRELQHRTANIVTVVSAIARMVSRAGPPETFLQRFEPRVGNLAQNLKLREAKEHVTLRATIDAALTPFLTNALVNVVLEGPDVSVTPHDSQVYAIIIHELATNSVKHGALTQVGAAVHISWATDKDGGILFRWQETRRLPADRPRDAGFGTQMLEQFAALSLNGEATQSFEEFGYLYELRVPGNR